MLDPALERFAQQGAAPLPAATQEGMVDHEGAHIWYAAFGAGAPVILLHGGLGHSGNWGYQMAALLDAGYRPILIDSRGHGRSTRDDQPFTYERMASDVQAVMDALDVAEAALVGWSDGACTALILGAKTPERVAGVLFFGCNMDPSGTKEFELTPIVQRCLHRHAADYAQLSATPEAFDAFCAAVGLMMQTQPNYTEAMLSQIQVPVEIVQSEHDEFIRHEHALYLAQTVPGASLTILPGVSHFAPLQDPALFNASLLRFLKTVLPIPEAVG
jgi:pimeloyl-ACP methyl ester carboxylesterase